MDMNYNRGWISLHRKVLDNPVVPMSKPFSKFEAWVYLLLSVNHSEGKVVIGNDIQVVEKGSRITSIMKLCKSFGWGNTRVRNFLVLLQKDDMIRFESNSLFTKISICNYSTYQTPAEPDKSVTNYEQLDANLETHTNNKNLIIKNKKITKVASGLVNSLFNTFWKKYPKKRGKDKAEISFNKLSENQKMKAVDSIDNHVDYWIKSETDMQYIPYPATWLGQGRYEDELEIKTISEITSKQIADRQAKRQKEYFTKAEKEKATPEETSRILKDAISQITKKSDDFFKKGEAK